MDKIRVGFTDYFKGVDDFFVSWLSSEFEVVRDDANPEFLFFCDETFGVNNLNYDPNKVVKIFYTGENRRPWNYQAHAFVTFDHFDQPNHYRLPLYVIDHWIMQTKLNMEPMWCRVYDRRKRPRKTKFCCFISGNPSNNHRNEFFHKLSKYKQVDSYGPLFNNMGYVLPRGDEAAKNKDSVMLDYKFNLCFENSEFPGYCTEKLFHAFYSMTVPIYCGSTTAGGVDFNPNAFLNWHDYLDDDRLIESIIALDNDDVAYNDMYHESPFSTYNTNKFFDRSRFVDWFKKNIYSARKV